MFPFERAEAPVADAATTRASRSGDPSLNAGGIPAPVWAYAPTLAHPRVTFPQLAIRVCEVRYAAWTAAASR